MPDSCYIVQSLVLFNSVLNIRSIHLNTYDTKPIWPLPLNQTSLKSNPNTHPSEWENRTVISAVISLDVLCQTMNEIGQISYKP